MSKARVSMLVPAVLGGCKAARLCSGGRSSRRSFARKVERGEV